MAKKLYIDLYGNNNAADYFEIEVEEMPVFTTELADDIRSQYCERKKWPELLIKNYPYKYNLAVAGSLGEDAINKEKLYNLITELSPTQWIFIKYVDDENSEIIYGYFGVFDCSVYFIEPHKVYIKVTPTVFDQYTYFLENWETKVKVLGDNNLITNSDFDVWQNDLPVGWNCLPLSPAADIPKYDIILDSNVISLRLLVIGDTIVLQNSVSQTIYNIQSGRTVNISFLYALIETTNTESARENLKIKIKLTDGTQTKYLDVNNDWIDSDLMFDYDTNRVPIPESELQKFYSKNIVISEIPFTGDITITFYHLATSVYNDDLNKILDSSIVITNVQLFSSDLEYKAINLELSSANLVIKEQGEIKESDGSYIDKKFGANPLNNREKDIEDYFDAEGIPEIDGYLSDSKHGPNDRHGFYYSDWIKTFDPDEGATPEHTNFYCGEICELTMYRGIKWRSWGLTYRRHIRSIAKFAREEYRKIDETYTAEDEEAGLGNEGDFIPPEANVGWVRLANDVNSNGTLWVRKPFNGGITEEWELGEKDTTGGVHEYGFTWEEKITSKRIYPIGENDLEETVGVDFKDIVRKIYRGTHSLLANKEVYSTFLWNDLETEYQVYDPSFQVDSNYYTRVSPNIFNKIIAIHTYNFKTDKTDSDEDSVLELSAKDFLEDIKNMPIGLFWYIDSNWNLHIEQNLFEEKVGLYDVEGISELVDNYQAWSFDKDKMYATTEYNQENSGHTDFALNKVTFNQIVTNKRNIDLKETISVKNLFTDMQYCMENPDDLSNGLLLVQYDDSTGSNKNVFATGKLSGANVPNGNLSIANLLSTYGNWEGAWTKGYINGVETEFKRTKYIKEGIEEIQIKGIYKGSYFLTDIGIGFAHTKKYDYAKGVTTLNLIYRYENWFIIVEPDNILAL